MRENRRQENRTAHTARLDKVLATAGLGSRSEVRGLIRSGRVRVHGETVTDPARRVDATGSGVEVDRRPVDAGSVTLMLNKPRGVVSASRDPGQKTVIDLAPESLRKRLFPAGRLDKETEGLLILTDDGDLCHRIISPKHHVEKEYIAELSGHVRSEMVQAFAEGITLRDGTRTRPARLEVASPSGTCARVVITEGKYHQVRRMFAAVGLKVLGLKRVRIGKLVLDDALAPGECRPLSPDEIELLFR